MSIASGLKAGGLLTFIVYIVLRVGLVAEPICISSPTYLLSPLLFSFAFGNGKYSPQRRYALTYSVLLFL